MGSRPFKGLFLHKTDAPFFFSFVTYTPQTKEQMIACGDLAEGEEYLSQIFCDFLLFIFVSLDRFRKCNNFSLALRHIPMITLTKYF